MTSTEILCKYTAGEASFEEVNEELEAIGNPLRLNPEKNIIKPRDIEKYGLLNCGWGDLDKVAIRDMKLAFDDMGDAPATCYYMGKLYEVRGRELVEMEG